MKKIIYTSIVSVIITILVSLNVFAMPYNLNQPKSINVYSELLSPNVKQSKVTEEAKARGDFFLRADLSYKA